MLKKSVFLGFLLFQIAWAGRFCVHIGDVAYPGKEKTGLEQWMRQLPDPSYLPDGNGTLSLFVGGWERQEYAGVLLPLIRSRFPYAKVVTCEGTLPFEGTLSDLSEAADARKGKPTEVSQPTDVWDRLAARLRKESGSAPRAALSEGGTPPAESDEVTWRTGWYLRSNVGYDSVNNDAAYDVRLEWDLFKEGFMDARRRLKAAKEKEAISRWRDGRYEKGIDRRLLGAKMARYRDRAMAEIERLRLVLYRYLYTDGALRLKRGAITRFALRDLNATLRACEDRLARYEARDGEKMPPAVWRLFVEAGELDPISLAEMVQKLKQKRRLLPKPTQEREWERWSERLRLNLYAGYRNLYIDQDQALVGVDAKIPLFVDDQADRMARMRDRRVRSLQEKELALEVELLRREHAELVYHRKRIGSLTARLRDIRASLKELTQIEKSAYAIYAGDLYQRKRRLLEAYLANMQALIDARFDLLERLYGLALLIGVEPERLLVDR